MFLHADIYQVNKNLYNELLDRVLFFLKLKQMQSPDNKFLS